MNASTMLQIYTDGHQLATGNEVRLAELQRQRDALQAKVEQAMATTYVANISLGLLWRKSHSPSLQ